MLPTLEAPELVFGLCSPIGTGNQKIIDLIKVGLLKYKYGCVQFKVTSLMKAVKLKDYELKDSPVEERYDTHIKYANKLREIFEYPSVLSMLCCGALRAYRRKEGGDPDSYMPGKAYIFDQFKRKEEIELLRQVYGRLFIQISIYSDKELRMERLSEKIASDHSISRPTNDHENDARGLIIRDEDEEDVPSGQKLKDTFPLADLFVNIDDVEAAEKVVDRFLQSLFGSNKISPTREEYGMYIAKSAALRSLDLSRQVGAAIFSTRGEVISLGCNEVPKAGGGTYWSGDRPDYRDFVLEKDENERIKHSLLADIVRRLHDRKLIKEGKEVESVVELVIEEAKKKGSVLRDAQLMDLLEFGRIIHAEMSAISDAARLGLAVGDAVLYCTTFPCHICAKHIVSSGIKKVFFIEPYPKSYAEQLHKDSIVIKAGNYDGHKTQFSPFIGISPFRFRELFERGKRKDAAGAFSEWMYDKPQPIVRYTVATYLQNEAAMTKIFEMKLTELTAKGAVSLQP